MISPIQLNKIQTNYNPSFQAFHLSNCHYVKPELRVYQLEKLEIDYDYIKFIKNNLGRFFKKFEILDDSRKQVVEEAIGATMKILESETEEKAKVFMSFQDKKPSSILIGNALKVDKNGKLHYSSRKNHAENETEVDWLATWNNDIPGEGKATVNEYFISLLEDGFKQVFVRSEVPYKSSAETFYKKMYFEPIASERPILRKNDNQYLIGSYDDPNDTIIPMKATVQDIKKAIKKYSALLRREEVKDRLSVTLPELDLSI